MLLTCRPLIFSDYRVCLVMCGWLASQVDLSFIHILMGPLNRYTSTVIKFLENNFFNVFEFEALISALGMSLKSTTCFCLPFGLLEDYSFNRLNIKML